MQLTISVLSNHSHPFYLEILATISNCECRIIELRSSRLANSYVAYLLIEGHWNQIAKLESILENLKNRLEIQIQTCRPESEHSTKEAIPYSLETLSLDGENIVECILTFLVQRRINIEDICASTYQASYFNSQLFSTKFIISIPPEVRLLALREEFLEFCDNLNIDAIIEPIKR